MNHILFTYTSTMLEHTRRLLKRAAPRIIAQDEWKQEFLVRPYTEHDEQGRRTLQFEHYNGIAISDMRLRRLCTQLCINETRGGYCKGEVIETYWARVVSPVHGGWPRCRSRMLGDLRL